MSTRESRSGGLSGRSGEGGYRFGWSDGGTIGGVTGGVSVEAGEWGVSVRGRPGP